MLKTIASLVLLLFVSSQKPNSPTPTQENIFIYYTSDQGTSGRDIYRMDAQGGNRRKLTSKTGRGHYPHNNGPKLSPDRARLVFHSDPDGHDRYTIWTMNIDGSGLKKITTAEGLYPAWSPDGKMIVFSGRRGGVWEILTVSADGSWHETNISQNKKHGRKPGWGATAAYHPNGERIVYSYIREKMLYTMELKSGQVTQLGENGSKYTHPIYSPDGERIAVNLDEGNGYHLAIWEHQGSKRIVAENSLSYSTPSWSHDGSEILFSRKAGGSPEIFKITLETGKVTQLTDNPAFDAMSTW